eukprot:566942-Rhodomonas_salina.2
MPTTWCPRTTSTSPLPSTASRSPARGEVSLARSLARSLCQACLTSSKVVSAISFQFPVWHLSGCCCVVAQFVPVACRSAPARRRREARGPPHARRRARSVAGLRARPVAVHAGRGDHRPEPQGLLVRR